jgi:hypothetical protein
MRNTRREKGLTKPLVPQSPNDGQHGSTRLFSQLATVTSREAGRAWVFVFALAIIVAWVVTGPFFNFSDTWQLVINTGTTIVTFLMVLARCRSAPARKRSFAVAACKIVHADRANMVARASFR